MFSRLSKIKMNVQNIIPYCVRMMSVSGLVTAGLIIALMLPVLNVIADEGSVDPAYGAINPSYRVSDSPFLRLSDDKRNWPPIVPPEPREVEESEDPTAVEIYNVATGEVTRIPSNDPTQQPIEPGLTPTLPYQGLLPPGIVPESVIGIDDRSRVTPTTSYPWRTICKLFIKAADDTGWIGSGEIIGRADGNGFHIYTAGHCVYIHDHGGWVKSIEVIPGFDDGYMPYNHAWATYLRTYTGWTNDENHQHDWAVVTLDRRVGNFTGWMGRMTASSSHSVYTGTLNAAGYPGDLMSGLGLYFDADSGRTANTNNHWYYMDTAGGQSGGPVWVYYTSSGNRYILTIHAYGNDGSGSNHGTRLNEDKFDRTITWINTDTPPTDRADLLDDGQAYSGFNKTLVKSGTSFNVWCDVRNIGTASSGSFNVSYYASTNTQITTSDHLIGTDSVSSVSPFSYEDSDWSGSFPAGVPSGTYYVGWIIDSGGVVTEFNEGNNTAYSTDAQLVVDNSPPPAPVISSSTHPENVWKTSDDPAFSWTAPSDASGITGYSYAFDNSSSTTPDTISEGTGRSKSYSNKANGTWYFHARAKDGAGNWGSTDHYGPVKVDDANPSTPSISSSTHPSQTTWYVNDDPSFSWSATDSHSGIKGYYYGLDDTTPDTWTTSTSKTYSNVSSGTHKFYVQAEDNAGNKSSVSSYTVKVDNVKPSTPSISSSTHPSQTTWYANDDPSFSWSASDSHSGIKGYYYGLDDATPDTWTTSTSKTYSNVSPGTHKFYVQAEDNAGNKSSVGQYTINICTMPVAAFVGTPTSGCAPLDVQFTDKSTGNPSSWKWDFDNDGTVDSTAKNPIYAYANEGTYTVKLTVQNDCGSDSKSVSGYIKVSGVAPIVDFSADPTSGCAPLNVKFTDNSTNNPTSWDWDFDNDGTVDSMEQNPSYTYTNEGTYTVKLVVRNDCGASDKTKTDYITVSGVAPIVDFSADPTSGCAPLNVQFTDNSTNNPTSWDWDFDNDGTVDSMEQNPSYTYVSEGTYTVKLVVRNDCGASDKTKTDYITVGGVAPTADFSADPTSGPAPLDVQFTDNSTNNPTSWDWDFDNDGTVDSMEQNPSYTYVSEGTYTVKLVVRNDCGASDKTKTDYITVGSAGICVWPGDTNNSGKVGIADVLPIGLHWKKTGPARQNPGCVWNCQPVGTWAPPQAAYADANGDGEVNQADIMCIGLNWGRTHTGSPAAPSLPISNAHTPLITPATTSATQAGSTFTVDIKVDKASNLFGVAFALQYTNPRGVNVLSVDKGDFLGDDVLFYPHIDAENGIVNIGISRKHPDIGVNGSGVVAKVRFQSHADAPSLTVTNLAIKEVTANNPSGDSIIFGMPVLPNHASVVVHPMPKTSQLLQNFPNPFNPETWIPFKLSFPADVKIRIYDVSGNLIRKIDLGHKSGGVYISRDMAAYWDGKNSNGEVVSSGIYLYTIQAGQFSATKRMIVVR